jgi:glycosyl-4,4'-diaponeurosporenoate acyltransferase
MTRGAHHLPWRLALVDAGIWLVVHVVVGAIGHFLPDSVFASDRGWWRIRTFESEGRLWSRRFAVERWKDRLPEAGGWLPGGISKRRVPGRSGADLALLARETRRAEAVHVVSGLAGIAATAWNPAALAAANVVFALVFESPFVVVQRYNRARIERVLARRRARQASASGLDDSGGPPSWPGSRKIVRR